MATNTTNYKLIKPGVNDPTDQDLWGGYLNSNFDIIDSQLKVASNTITRSISGNDLIGSGDNNKLLLIDAVGSNLSISLDDASTVGDGFSVFVKKVDATTNTITITSNDQIDNAVNLVLNAPNSAYQITSNGTEYYISSAYEQIDFASNTESNAGTADNRALTPANFGSQNDHTANGYQRLPGGLIFQWGKFTNVSLNEALQAVTFEIPFTSVPFFVSAQITRYSNTFGAVGSDIQNVTTTGMEVRGDPSDPGSAGNGDIYWFVVGV